MAGNQKFICVGTLGNDVKIRQMNKGPLGEINVFVKEQWTTKVGEKCERLQIFHCNIWGNKVLAIEHLLKKGSKVYIEGKIVMRSSFDEILKVENKYVVVDAEVVTVTHVKQDGEYAEAELVNQNV